MGAQGYKNFENNGAAAFLIQVEEEGITKIYQAILRVIELPETENLNARYAEEAIAAIEYVAAAKGHPHPDFPQESKRWMRDKYVADILETNPNDAHKANFDITEISLEAIDRIKTKSALRDVWENTEYNDQWQKEIEDLRKRVS